MIKGKIENKFRTLASSIFFGVGVLFCHFIPEALAQVPTTQHAFPLITNHLPRDYKGHGQVWTFQQDSLDNIYMGTSTSLIKFDGLDYQDLISGVSQGAFSMDRDKKGNLFLGGDGFFGRLVQDSSYPTHIQYLSDSLDEPVAEIWHTLCTSQGDTYWLSRKKIYHFRNERLKVIEPHREIHTAFMVEDTLYVKIIGESFHQLVGEQLLPWKKGDYFKNTRVYGFLKITTKESSQEGKHTKSKWIVASREQGLLYHDGRQWVPFAKGLNDELIKGEIYHMSPIQLPKGEGLAIGTLQNGLYIFNEEGKLVWKLDEANGLVDNNIKRVKQDRWGHLWVGTENGFSYVEIGNNFRILDKRNGLLGSVNHLFEGKDGGLYVSTSRGLFYSKSKAHYSFEKVEGSEGQCWTYSEIENNGFLASNSGLTVYPKNGTPYKLLKNQKVWNVKAFPKYLDIALVGSLFGFYVIKKVGDKWEELPEKLHAEFQTRFFEWENDSSLFSTDFTKGVFKWPFPISQQKEILSHSKVGKPIFTKLGEEKGFQTKLENRVLKYEGKVYFTNQRGLFYWDSSAQVLKEVREVNETYIRPALILWFFPQEDKKVNWIWDENGIKKVREKDSSWVQEDLFFRRVKYLTDDYVYPNFIISDNDELWIATREGILRANFLTDSVIRNTKVPQLYFKEVSTFGKKDELLFFGQNKINSDNKRIILDFHQGNLRVELASPFYENSLPMQFCFSLNESSNDLDGFSKVPVKEYTNLQEGTYTLMAKARNAYGIESEPIYLEFEIQPPFYRSIFAYILYFVTGILLLFLIVKLLSLRSSRYQEKLEKIIQQRTQMVERQKKEIEKQRDDLAEKNRKIIDVQKQITEANEELRSINSMLEEKVKERTENLRKSNEFLVTAYEELDTFIYRSSHDLRGPIASLLGISNLAKLEMQDERSMEYIDLLEKTALQMGRVLKKLMTINIINKSQPERKEIIFEEKVHQILSGLQRDIQERQVKIGLDIQPTINYQADPDLIEFILQSLIENAIQYSKPKGEGKVRIKISSTSNQVSLDIEDNGYGIADDYRERVFDMFFVASELSSGNGLGLYIAKKGVHKLSGEIQLLSKEGAYTKVHVVLPLHFEYQERI